MSVVPAESADLVERSDPGAPLVLITGLPGDGKSLFALKRFAVGKTGVKQHGIPGCVLPSFDATKWASELSPGETGIVDEAQDVFPPKSATADPPEHYKLNKIRHGGRALILITQEPHMIDSRVRRLCGRHIHVKRVFGTERAVLHEWHGRIGDTATCAESAQTLFPYPREVYSLYKSADLHRKRAPVPLKLKLIPVYVLLSFALLGAGGWFIYGWVSGLQDKANSKGKPPGLAGMFVDAGGRSGSARPAEPRPDYFAAHVPRIPGLPHTAPRFDELTKPVRAPLPLACVASASRCGCYSQQATRMQVPESLCRTIVAEGFFVDFDDVDTKAARDQSTQAQHAERVARVDQERTTAWQPVSAVSLGSAK